MYLEGVEQSLEQHTVGTQHVFVEWIKYVGHKSVIPVGTPFISTHGKQELWIPKYFTKGNWKCFPKVSLDPG